jgi:CubicO group peptidase (beta-lactamase class C family)
MNPSGKKTYVLWIGSLFIMFSGHLLAFQAYTHTALTDKVDALFRAWDKENSPGAALGIFQDGRIIYARGYGMANLDYNIPITPQTVFRVGSVSKQFTAMCIALLVEQGKIALDDDIRKVLPEMPAFDPPVKISHMLHHTSGLRDYLILQGLAGRSGGYYYTSPEVVDLLSRQKSLNFSPRDQYSYSNSGYFLLAQAVGRASGMRTADFAKKNIFDPLGMEDTHFHDDPKMVVKNRAMGYLPRKDGGFKIHVTQLDMIGDGGIFTTVEDFFRWDQNFYDNRLGAGSQGLIELILSRDKLNGGRENDYAFGLVVSSYRGLRMISHGGSFVGYRAHYLQFPEQRFSVVILSNLGTFNPGRIAVKIAEVFLAGQFTKAGPAVKELPPAKEPAFIKLDNQEMKKFLGQYHSTELDATAIVSLGKEGLVLKLGRHISPLRPVSPQSFLSTYENDDAYELGTRKIEFVLSEGKKAVAFVMSAEDIRGLRFDRTD